MKYLSFFFLLICMASCGEDHVTTTTTILENETISGRVMLDDLDTCCVRGKVYISRMVMDSILVDLASTTFSSDGFYQFNNILPGQDSLIIHISGDFEIVSAVDVSPDGDVGELDPSTPYIPVYLEEGENDTDNHFVVQKKSCSLGYVQGSVFGVSGSDTSELDLVSLELYSIQPDGSISSLVDTRFGGAHYTFSVPDNANYLIRLDASGSGFSQNYTMISGLDITPDNDEAGGDGELNISVVLDSCETDGGNNFYIHYPEMIGGTISGNVLIDQDGDGVGDQGIEGMRIELYRRNAQQVPLGPIISGLNSNADGSFSFDRLDQGEYVLYYIGDPYHTLVSAADLSPETGEPMAVNLIHLPVDILASGDVDSDNTFVVERSSICNDEPVILPYWALCDTALVCTYDEVPVYVTDATGNVITTAGGLYQLLWTDMLTEETFQGDWIYHKTNHPIKLDIIYPSGCSYTVYYHRECPQDFSGNHSLIMMTTGFGPTYSYAPGQVIWDINPFDRQVHILHNIPMTDNPNLIPPGLYSYVQTFSSKPYKVTLRSIVTGQSFEVGWVGLSPNGSLYLDDNVAADGIGRFFKRL